MFVHCYSQILIYFVSSCIFVGSRLLWLTAVKHQLLVAFRVCMFSNFTYGFLSELKDWKAMPPKKRDYSCRLSQSSNLCGALSTRNLSSIFATLSKALVSYYKDDQTFSFNIALEDVLPSVKPHVSTLHKLDNRFTEETVTSTVLRNNASLRYSLPISLAWINICFKDGAYFCNCTIIRFAHLKILGWCLIT